MRTDCHTVKISIRVESFRLVKVRAYIRVRNGKVEIVKGHYRKY